MKRNRYKVSQKVLAKNVEAAIRLAGYNSRTAACMAAIMMRVAHKSFSQMAALGL